MTNELHEILELYCELLLARIGLLEPSYAPTSAAAPNSYSTQYIDPGLEEAIIALVHAAPRTEIKELQTVRALLVEKFGREFALKCTDDPDGKVPERVRRKLKVEPPSNELVENYLQAIAAAYSIPYGDSSVTDAGPDDEDEGGSGGIAESIETPKKNLEPPLPAQAQSLREASSPPAREPGRSPVSVAPPSPRTEDPSPKVKLPGPPELKPSAKIQGRKQSLAGVAPKANGSTGKKPEGDIPDVDDLEKRFAMLKR